MKLSIVIVTYNSANHIKACLESIVKTKARDCEIIIVDNGSEDNTKEIVEKFRRVLLITSQENLGFGKGSNKGASKANGEFLLFLNPDTKVTKDALVKLVEFANNNEFGIVAPSLIKPSGEIQASVSNNPTIWNATKEYFLGIKNSYSEYVPKGREVAEVECVYGAAMLIKRSIFEKLGGFSAKYFMYFEDLDLCRRVRNLGLKIFYLPTVKIYHDVGGTIDSRENSKRWLIESAKIFHGSLNYYFIYLILFIGQKLRKK